MRNGKASAVLALAFALTKEQAVVLDRYRRVTELFTEGTEVVLDRGIDGQAVLMWVQKLNSFERDEARKDAQVARSRVMMALRDEGSDEQLVLQARTESMSDTELIESIIDVDGRDLLVKTVDEVASDPEWSERIAVLQRSDEQLRGAGRTDPNDPEVQLLQKLNAEYLAELQTRSDRRRQEQRVEYSHLAIGELRKKYEERYTEDRTMNEFLTHFRLSELYYGVRVCSATQKVDEAWDHGSCGNHRQRVFASRDELREQPEELLERLRVAVEMLAMSTREAKNLDRQGSSSESSPLPSEPEASEPSTQEATSLALVGTSPSP